LCHVEMVNREKKIMKKIGKIKKRWSLPEEKGPLELVGEIHKGLGLLSIKGIRRKKGG